jgi:hypothetical protein
MKLHEDGENCLMRSFIICAFSKYSKYDEIKEDKMGRA